MRRHTLFFSFFLIWLVVPYTASAHQFAYAAFQSAFKIRDKEISFEATLSQPLPFPELSEQASDAYFEDYFIRRMTVHNDGMPCFLALAPSQSAAADTTVFRGTFTCQSTVSSLERLSIHIATFSDFFETFDHFVTITIDDRESHRLVFTQNRWDYPSTVSAMPLSDSSDGLFAATTQFFHLGTEHIWTGIDHILFLLSIVLLVRAVRTLVFLVTSFTIAHSLTLFLAAFHIVELSPIIVEPAIALTICLAAIRNMIIIRSETTAKMNVSLGIFAVFCLGLIHGLGFASALAETGLPPDFFIPALFSFNVGIEAGQLLILLVAIPLLFFVDKTRHATKILTGISGLILLVACFWFLERISF